MQGAREGYLMSCAHTCVYYTSVGTSIIIKWPKLSHLSTTSLVLVSQTERRRSYIELGTPSILCIRIVILIRYLLALSLHPPWPMVKWSWPRFHGFSWVILHNIINVDLSHVFCDQAFRIPLITCIFFLLYVSFLLSHSMWQKPGCLLHNLPITMRSIPTQLTNNNEINMGPCNIYRPYITLFCVVACALFKLFCMLHITCNINWSQVCME